MSFLKVQGTGCRVQGLSSTDFGAKVKGMKGSKVVWNYMKF
jgi:hypothetical protein